MEYEAKNLDKILQNSKNLEDQNEALIKMVKRFNMALLDLQGVSTKSAQALKKEYQNAINSCNEALNHFTSNATKVLQKQVNDIQKMSREQKKSAKDIINKDSMESNIKELEILTKKWQDNERKIAKSKNSLLKGKKNTPIEDSYLIREQQELQKQITKTKKDIESLYRTYNGAKSTGSKAIKHSEDAQSFTLANIKQRESRDILNETQGIYNKLQASVTDLTKRYGANNEATLKEKEALNNIVELREKATAQLKEAQIELQAIGRLTEEEGKDVLNQVANQDKRAQMERESAQQKKNTADAEKQLLNLTEQQHQIEQKIYKLSIDEKGRVSNVAQLKHKNELEVLKQQSAEIKGQISSLETKNNLQGKSAQKLKEIAQQENESRKIIDAKNKDLQDQGQILGDSIKNFAKFTAYYKTLNLAMQGVQNAIDTMKELDAAFTDIRIVTGDSVEATNQLAKEYNGLAKEMGATTTEVAAGAGEWLRQGKTAKETTQLLKASMTLSKVGAIESSEATQLLTSSLNGYKVAAKDAMTVVDKISAIDLAAATSSEELATALARTANIANDSSVSFDKLLAMIGTVSSVTRRSASTIRRSI